jgi:YqaJ-like viral recombinase domain
MGQGWGSKLSVWLDKKGLLPEREESEAMYWGTKLEPLLVEEFCKRTGHALRPFLGYVAEHWSGHQRLEDDRGYTRDVYEGSYRWARCTPDAFYVRSDGSVGGLECKTTGFRNGDAWRDTAPLAAQIQAQWQLYVSGLEHGALVCLIGGQRFVGYEFTRNERFIAHMASEAERFWVEHVLADVEPEPDARDLELARDLAAWPSNGSVVVLPEEAIIVDQQLEDASAELAGAEHLVAACKARIIRWIGNAEFGQILGAGIRYRLHKYERAGSEVRQLRRIETRP